jgi:hypothetical protein
VAEEALTRILSEAREHYLAHYRRVIRRARADRPEAVPEVLVELDTPGSSLVRRLNRVDVIWGGAANPSIIEANVDPVSTAACLHSEPGPPALRAFPLVWNSFEVVYPDEVDLGSGFTQWFERWLDVDDAQVPDEDGLAGVIHSVTVPGPFLTGWGFSVDMGSAPVSAVIELLALPALRQVGAVDIGSFTYGQ